MQQWTKLYRQISIGSNSQQRNSMTEKRSVYHAIIYIAHPFGGDPANIVKVEKSSPS